MKGAAVWRFGKPLFRKRGKSSGSIRTRNRFSSARGSYLLRPKPGGCLVFAFVQRRKIATEPRLTEDLILVIEVFSPAERCKGIASALVGHIKEQAIAAESYQVIAYYAPDNLPSHKLWIKNQFCVTPPDPKLDRHLSSCCALYKCCVSPAHRKKGLSYENHDCGRSP